MMKMDLNQALEQLASAFNTTVEKLYPLLIKQAYVTGVTNILGILIMWAVFATLLVILKKHGIKKEKYYGMTDGTFFLLVTTVIISVITVVITVTVGHEAITALINPEYWALKEVLSYIK